MLWWPETTTNSDTAGNGAVNWSWGAERVIDAVPAARYLRSNIFLLMLTDTID
jgi:hypothetical protein